MNEQSRHSEEMERRLSAMEPARWMVAIGAAYLKSGFLTAEQYALVTGLRASPSQLNRERRPATPPSSGFTNGP